MPALILFLIQKEAPVLIMNYSTQSDEYITLYLNDIGNTNRRNGQYTLVVKTEKD